MFPPGFGSGFTVTSKVTVQLTPVVYEMVVVLTKLPVTIPEPDPTDATEELLLLHTPPETELLNVVVPLRHKDGEPDIIVGNALTVTSLSAAQPDGNT